MADIPLFTGQVSYTPSRFQPPVESLSDVALKAAKLGEMTPSVATSIAKGITGGIEAYQNVRMNEANIEAQQANAQLAQAKIENLPYEQQTAIYQAQTARIEAENKAKLGPMMAQAELEKARAMGLEAEVKFEELQTQQKLRNQQLEVKAGINSTLNSLESAASNPSPESLAVFSQGLSSLESKLPDVINSSFNRDKDGKITEVSPLVVGQIRDLPRQAEKTGNPDLIQKATILAKRYEDGINTQILASDKKQIDLGLEPSRGAGQTIQERRIQDIMGSPSPFGAPGQAQPTPPAVPSTTFQGTPQVSQTERPREEEFFERALEQSIGTPSDIINEIATQIKLSNPDLSSSDALREAREQYTSTLAPKDNERKDIAQMHNAAVSSQTSAQKIERALTNLGALMREDPTLDPAFGGTATIQSTLNKLEATIGQNPEKRKLIDEIKADIDAVGNYQALALISQELNLGTLAVNTDAERAAAKNLGFNTELSLEQNMQALELLKSKAEQYKGMSDIISVYRNTLNSVPDAFDAAQRWQRTQPPTIIKDKKDAQGNITGVEIVRNPDKISPAQFINQQLNLSRETGVRTSDGRLTNKAPADAPKEAVALGNLITNGDTSALKNLYAQTSGDDVPLRQPQGATTETILRLVAAESSMNPSAVGTNPVSQGQARGLMQLTDPTGRAMWKKLGFEGEYNPEDPAKNIIMGTAYLNQQLKDFGGDTKLALAAYNAGPGRVKAAQKKALENLRDGSWESTQLYLSESTPEDKFAKAQVIPFVDRIVNGDKKKDTVSSEALAALPENLRETAASTLTPEGLQLLQDSAKYTSLEEAQGSPIAGAIDMLLSPLATEAQAQEFNELFPSIGQEGATPAENEPGMLQKGAIIAARNIPPQLQSFALGATNSLLFGLNDEAAALLRMAVVGEDYETAVRTTRQVQEQFQRQNPNFYTGGQVGGALLGAKGLSMAKGAAPAVASEAVAPEVARQTMGQAIKTGSLIGAGGGAAQGFGEGEGGFGNRLRNSLLNAGLGTVTGGALTGTINLGGKLVSGERLVKLVEKLSGTKPEKLTEGEAFLAKQLKDVSPEDWNKASVQLAGLDDGSSRTLATELPEGYIEQVKDLIDVASKEPGIGGKFKQLARERLKESEVGQRLSKVFNKYTDELEPIEAFDNFATAVKAKADSIREARAKIAKPLYKEAQETLPQLEEGIPGFISEEVNEAVTDSWIKRAIRQSHSDIDPDKVLPDKSLEILQRAKGILRRDSLDRTDPDLARRSRDALTKLRTAMHNESDALRKADTFYYEGSQIIDKMDTKAANKILDFADADEVTNVEKLGDALFSFDTRTIKTVANSLEPEQQRQMKNAARAHIENLILNQKDFPAALSKNKFSEKIRAIFGDAEGKAILKDLKTEKTINEVNRVVEKAGSQTAIRQGVKEEFLSDGISQEQTRGLVDASVSLATFGAYGAPQATRSLFNIFKKRPETKELMQEVTEILIADPTRGKEAADKIRKELVRSKVSDEVVNSFNKIINFIEDDPAKFLAQIESQVGASERETFQDNVEQVDLLEKGLADIKSRDTGSPTELRIQGPGIKAE